MKKLSFFTIHFILMASIFLILANYFNFIKIKESEFLFSTWGIMFIIGSSLHYRLDKLENKK